MSNTWLYHVLTTLANLYHIYSNLDLGEDADVCKQVLASLEKCWAAADQDPFIAAVILSPFLHGDFLGQHIALTLIGLCNMLKCLLSACSEWMLMPISKPCLWTTITSEMNFLQKPWP